MLLQLRDDVISDGKSLLFRQPFLQAAYDLAGARQCESNGVSEDFCLRHDQGNINRTRMQATTF